jgi:hypothetical protein
VIRGTLSRAALAAAVAALLAGCASSGGGELAGDPAGYGSPDPRMAIERFLQGAAEKDYQMMGQQFGTAAGPAEERLGITEVEQRMMFLSGLLQHRDYELREADLARTGPGRTRFVVTLVRGERDRVDVPVVTAVTDDERWFVETIDTDPLTRDR